VRKVSPNVFTEVYFWGCNPSFVSTSDGVFVIDTPQQPIDSVRWKEWLAESYPGPIRYLVNTEPHIDYISGNAYFPVVEVIGHVGLQARYEQAVPQMTAPERIEMMMQADPDSVWLMNHPSFPPNPPTQLFTDSLTIQSGNVFPPVQDFLERGLSVDDAVQQPLSMNDIDPYPIGQRLFARSDWVNEANIRNLYAKIGARQMVTV
jgi:glyoxylase-like metal-dependent hydrolase (beta-lactamase superfamily II)